MLATSTVDPTKEKRLRQPKGPRGFSELKAHDIYEAYSKTPGGDELPFNDLSQP